MTDARSTVLLDADPDLGRLLDDERLAEARRQLVVRPHTVEPGPWDGERLRDARPEHVGLFILDGLMTRELALADNVAAELLGPGDVVRPWQARAPERLVPFGVRWSVTALSALGLRQPALGLGHGGSLPIGPAHCGPGPSQTHPEPVRNSDGRLARAVADQSDPFAARRAR